jgi:putative oxidoreductase
VALIWGFYRLQRSATQMDIEGESMTTAATLMLAGRIVFGLFFIIAAIRNTLHFKERLPSRTNYGRDMPPALVAVGFAMQWIGGLSLLLGFYPVLGALVLIVFLVLATAGYHNLFLFTGKERDQHLYLVLVNITLAGGLLLVIADSL